MRIIYIKTIIADSGAVYDGKIRAGIWLCILDIPTFVQLHTLCCLVLLAIMPSLINIYVISQVFVSYYPYEVFFKST